MGKRKGVSPYLLNQGCKRFLVQRKTPSWSKKGHQCIDGEWSLIWINVLDVRPVLLPAMQKTMWESSDPKNQPRVERLVGYS
jgi:hypothetical protein